VEITHASSGVASGRRSESMDGTAGWLACLLAGAATLRVEPLASPDIASSVDVVLMSSSSRAARKQPAVWRRRVAAGCLFVGTTT
jgi:hypothetical protein